MSAPNTNATLTVGAHILLENFPGKLFECTAVHSRPRFHVSTSFIYHKKTYIGVTSTNIVEVESNRRHGPLKINLLNDITSLERVKFRRGELISFYFKGDVEWRYSMLDCLDCVALVKEQMANSGISSRQILKKFSVSIETAQNLIDTTRELEKEFSAEPSLELVEKVMDLFREAVERFGEANDTRYHSAIEALHRFLHREDVLRILDESTQKSRTKLEVTNNSKTEDRPSRTDKSRGRISNSMVERDLQNMAHVLEVESRDCGVYNCGDDSLDIDDIYFQSFSPRGSNKETMNIIDNDDEHQIELNLLLANMTAELEHIVSHYEYSSPRKGMVPDDLKTNSTAFGDQLDNELKFIFDSI